MGRRSKKNSIEKSKNMIAYDDGSVTLFINFFLWFYDFAYR